VFLSSKVQTLRKIRIDAPMSTISTQMIFFIFARSVIDQRLCSEHNLPWLAGLMKLRFDAVMFLTIDTSLRHTAC
jgi:uncharacterized protein (DUF2342 family)